MRCGSLPVNQTAAEGGIRQQSCVHKQWLLAAGTLLRNTLHLILVWWQWAVKAATETHHSSSFDRTETLDRTCQYQTYILTLFLMAEGVPAGEPDELNFQRLRSIKELVRCLLNQNPAVEFKLHNLKRKVYGFKWCWLFFWQCGHNE